MRSRCLRVEIADRCFARPMINPRYKASLFHAFYYNYTCRRAISSLFASYQSCRTIAFLSLIPFFFFPFLFLFFTWSLTLQWEKKKTRSLIRFVDSLTRGKKCFVKFVIFPLYIYRYCVLDGDSVTRIARVFLGFKVFWYLSQRKRIYLGEETWRCYDIRGRARPRRLKKKCWRAGSSTSNLFLSGILLDR